MYAINNKGNKIEATPGVKAVCPFCQGIVTAVCGTKNVWHFRHEIPCPFLMDKEHETEIHRAWKRHFSTNEHCKIEYKIGQGIADVAYINGETRIAIEIQKSSILGKDLIRRSLNYLDNGFSVVWIFEVQETGENIDLIEKDENYYSFSWKWAKKYVADSVVLQKLGHMVQTYLSYYPGVTLNVKNIKLTENKAPKYGFGTNIENRNILENILKEDNSLKSSRLAELTKAADTLIHMKTTIDELNYKLRDIESEKISLSNKQIQIRNAENESISKIKRENEKLNDNMNKLKILQNEDISEKLKEDKERLNGEIILANILKKQLEKELDDLKTGNACINCEKLKKEREELADMRIKLTNKEENLKNQELLIKNMGWGR